MDIDGAFADWYRTAHPGVVRALTAAVGDAQVALDAADEAFARAAERWGTVREMHSRAGWVYRTALNVARRRARRAAIERTLLRRHRPAAAATFEPMDTQLWAAVARLPERQRLAIALRYIADLPEAVVADVMGVAVGTVSATLHAARRRLAQEPTVQVRESTHD